MEELISVIIPTYNSEKTIKNCIKSVLSQTYINFEIIVCDDMSTDQTRNILESFKDPRIKLKYLEKNSGSAVARNTAMSNAKGDFIAFLDSDDEWQREKLEKQLKLFEEEAVGITFTGALVFKNGTRRETYSPLLDWENDSYIKLFLGQIKYLTPTVMIRTSCLAKTGLMAEELKRNQDYDFFLRILRNYKLKIINDPLSIIYLNTRKVTFEKLIKSIEFYENERLDDFKKDFTNEQINLFFARKYKGLACDTLRSGKIIRSIVPIRKSLEYSKTLLFTPKNLMLIFKSFIIGVLNILKLL